MANTPIPTLAAGNILTASDWNDLVPLNTAVGLFDVSQSTTGGAPARTAPNYYIQCGGAEPVVLGGSSIGTITFPTAFPNGLVGVYIAPHLSVTAFGQAPILSSSQSNFTFVAYTVAGVGVGSGNTVSIDWFAIGW